MLISNRGNIQKVSDDLVDFINEYSKQYDQISVFIAMMGACGQIASQIMVSKEDYMQSASEYWDFYLNTRGENA